MTFCLNRLRLEFRALDRVQFPAAMPANILRGALGAEFRHMACVPECRDPRHCPQPAACLYARVFEPHAAQGRPSGLSDWPRPFVFRAAHLDGKAIAPEQPFHFDVNLFDTSPPLAAAFVDAFTAIASSGIGPARGRAECTASSCRLLELQLTPGAESIRKLTVRFVTPTELKDHGALADRPEFAILFGRVRDRIAALSDLYGPGPLPLDFKAMGDRAAAVRLTRCHLRQVAAFRRSGRSGHKHPLGGFVGEAEYEGDLTEFLPFLQAAPYTGVGRHTVWGKGQIELDW